MPVPQWLFGPAGDLRPLTPELNVVGTVDRFGGTHTSISGGLTVDSLGYRARYEFTLPSLEADEYEQLEALYTRQIPGPLYLVDPLRRNLLTREAASARPAGADRRGIYADAGGLSWVKVTDSPVARTQRAASWSGAPAGSSLFFDYGRRFPLLPGEDLTSSVYVRPTETIVVDWYVQLYNDGSPVGSLSPTEVTAPANVWTRVGATVPASELAAYDEAHVALNYVSGGTSSMQIQIIGAQAEFSSAATAPALGGGSVRVEIDKLDTKSPWYPERTVTLALLEV